jgi:hypothetical protein
MKFRAKSLFLGMCLAVGIFAVNVSAEARSTTGWNSFRPWPNPGWNNCVKEQDGAAVNGCSSTIGLTFETVVDNAGWHSIQVWNSAPGYGAVECAALAFSQQANSIYFGNAIDFSLSGQEEHTSTTYVYPGWALSLYCGTVSGGRGIANLNWNP